jgi:DNA-binding IclR family transcriptional regulator
MRLRLGMVTLVKLNEVDELVLSALKSSDMGLTLAEIAEKTGASEKKVFRALRKLFENEMIDCMNRRYRLVKR